MYIMYTYTHMIWGYVADIFAIIYLEIKVFLVVLYEQNIKRTEHA